jgi:hypothetical protein
MVCNKKIEKGSVRVAIERKIDTEGFSGVRPGYLHPGCAPKHADLKGMDDLDDRISRNSSIDWPASQ